MKKLNRLSLRDNPSHLIEYQNKACPFLTVKQPEETSSITPIRLRESVYSSNPDRAAEHWEQKAQNFRLIPRQVHPNTIRERVPITLNTSPQEKRSFSFDLKQNISHSASSTFSINSAISRRQSIEIKNPKRKKFRHKKLNFFLHI